jgi:hypothetical protein
MEKANRLTAFYNRIGITDRNCKRWFWIAFSLLAVYVSLVVYAQNVNLGYDFGIITAVSLILALAVCFFGVAFLGGIGLNVSLRETKI